MSVQIPLFEKTEAKGSKFAAAVEEIVGEGFNVKKFVENFEVLVNAVGATEGLRALVLHLAVQGRLLLETPRGVDETERSAGLEVPFGLPQAWEWKRVDELGELKLGRQRSPKNHAGPHMRPYLRVANVFEARIDTSDVLEMNFDPEEAERFLLKPNDILLNEGQSYELVGRPAIYRGEVPGACFQNTLIRFRPGSSVLPEYALVVFRAYMRIGRFRREAQQTTNIAHLSLGRLAQIEFPLPPLPEQKRIVAKVDQLMALCDELEARWTKKRETGARLTKSALAALATAEGPEEFDAAWKRVVENFDVLIDRAEKVGELRRTILSLAVRGRFHGVLDSTATTVGDLVGFQNGYAFKSEWFTNDGTRLLRNANVGHGVLRWDDVACVGERHVQEFARFALASGDVVVSLDRPIISTGVKVARVSVRDLPCLLLQRVGKVIIKDQSALQPDFFFWWLNSPCFVDSIDPGRSNGVPHISTRDIEALPFWAPPIDLQRDIVRFIEAVSAQCDLLEATLRRAEDRASKLVEAVVQELVA